MAKQIAFVRLNIARLGVEISDRASDPGALAEWAKTFHRALALNRPELNDYAAELLAEAKEFRENDRSRKPRIPMESNGKPVIPSESTPHTSIHTDIHTSIQTEKKKRVPQAAPFSHSWLSDPAFLQAWNGWIEARIAKRKKPTEYAKELAMAKLQTLSGGDIGVAIRIVNESAESGWDKFYQVKEDFHGNPKRTDATRDRSGKNSREFPEKLTL